MRGAGTSDVVHTYRFQTPSLNPGRHAFRLRQVDTDGTSVRSEAVHTLVALQEAARLLVAPNPVAQRAQVELHARTGQPVTVTLYDVLGRRVRTLWRGAAEAHQPVRIAFDASTLPGGVYVVRARGERFVRTQRLAVVR